MYKASSIFTNINELPFNNEEERTKLRVFFAYNDATKVEAILSTITEDEAKAEFLRGYVDKSRDEQPVQGKLKIANAFPEGLPYKEPRPLLYGTGSKWVYQSDKNLHEKLRDELKEHYTNFLNKNRDKSYIPMYLFLSGAGTGKSRNADEFQKTALECLSDDTDSRLKKRIQSAWVFKVGFENGDSMRHGVESSAYCAIGSRMLSQLIPNQHLDLIISNYEAPLPWEVIQLVANYEKRKLDDITIFLIVDGLQNIMRSIDDWNIKTSEFFQTITNTHDLALKDVFLIPLCTATVTGSVDNVLNITHRKRVFLPIASLNPPNIYKDGALTSVFKSDDYVIEILISDCGGHGRALEALQDILEKRDINNTNINDLMNDLRIRLRDRYSEALEFSSSITKTIARLILTQQLLEPDQYIPGTQKYPSQIVQPGLLRYEFEGDSKVGYLTAPYIWVWILTESSDGCKDPVLRDWCFCDYEDHKSKKNPSSPASQLWQRFEHFVASFRSLKSRNINDKEMTTISAIHAGAYLNGELQFVNHHLDLEYARHHEDTNSEHYTGSRYIQCENDSTVDVREGKCCIINGSSAPYGDAFLGLDINSHDNPNEVHQYRKWTKYTLNGSNFIKEREKSSSSRDFFLFFTTTKVNNIKLPENSGLVDSSNWRKYFGAFAGRAFAYANVGPLNINTAVKRDLELVKGIGETRADIIISARNKRKFNDPDDAYAETEKRIPMSALKRFKYE